MSDLIDRQDVLDAVNDCGICIQRILDIPSAEQEQKTGEWIEKEVFTSGKGRIREWQSAKCSVCGKYHTTPYLYYFGNYNYCPNFGARLEWDE